MYFNVMNNCIYVIHNLNTMKNQGLDFVKNLLINLKMCLKINILETKYNIL